MARGRAQGSGGGADEAQLSFEARFFPVPRPVPAPAARQEAVVPAPVPREEAVPSPPADLWQRGDGPDPEADPRPAASSTGTPVPGAAKTEPRVYAVSELVRAARLMLEARFADVYVQGEVSGFKRSGPGHLYFCLKDGEAQVDCAMFSREASRLKFRVQDGLLVRCRGRLTIYEGRGKFQMTVTALEPAGAGALALAFEQLKQRLAAEGLFDPGRKRPLPFLPRRIGVVTSQSGAVIRDIIRVAHRRFPVPLLLAPTPVQGEGAAASIIAALRRVVQAPEVDLVILARGGGSLEDLWCFNDEALARAIAVCPVPVISAVGHETDFTIADFVADLRAPTPSAAAELAVPVAADLLTELQVLNRRLCRGVESELRGARLLIERARARIADPRRLLDERRQAVDDLAGRATQALRGTINRRATALRALETRLYKAHPQRRIADQRAALAALERRLCNAIGQRLVPRRRAVESLQAKLQSLSPLSVLERGYSLTRRTGGEVVTRAAALIPGEAVTVTFRDGDATARVESVIERGAGAKAPEGEP